jgi:tRNA (mo5U34)-methyltransferase
MAIVNFELESSAATKLLGDSSIHWHQKFRLSDEFVTPGANSVDHLLRVTDLSAQIKGKSVLDVGTTNGAVAFWAERLGASRVVAIDIFDDDFFGFAKIRNSIQSQVEFRRCSVYAIDSEFVCKFDIVVFFGVLYHLRHPLLGLDALRAVASEVVFLETAIWQPEEPEAINPVARFHRLDDLKGDASNWWSPSIRCLVDWSESAGFETEILAKWPDDFPSRAAARLTVREGIPEFERVSYERKLHVRPLFNSQ